MRDFDKGLTHGAHRERSLSGRMMAAGEMYKGGQHRRLMEGVRLFRRAYPNDELSLWILSPGYSVIREDRSIAPYEATFDHLPQSMIRDIAEKRDIPANMRRICASSYDLGILLLGREYVLASDVQSIRLGAPAVAFCAESNLRDLSVISGLTPIVWGKSEAHQFGCALRELKGELARRLLRLRIDEPQRSVKDLICSSSRLKADLAKYRWRPGK